MLFPRKFRSLSCPHQSRYSRVLLAFLFMIYLLLFSSGCSKVEQGKAEGAASVVPVTFVTESAQMPMKDESLREKPEGKKSIETGTSEVSASSGSTQLSSAPTDTESSSEPVMLKYIDAWKEWHTMEVDPSVHKCIYDPKLFIEEENGLMTYKDDGCEVLQGIDVSEHQGYIDWEAVAQAGYSFAYIRVGYRGYGQAGNLFEDATAIDNLQRAKSAGLQVGTYIFSQALNEEEARAEADLAVGVILSSGVETDLPLMYDPELIKDDWGRANDISREQVSKNTAAFKNQVEKISGLNVDIYSNLPWEHHYFDADTLNQFEIWYADYEKKPQTPYHFSWWQYTNKGHVPGIDGQVDLNIWLRPYNNRSEKSTETEF